MKYRVNDVFSSLGFVWKQNGKDLCRQCSALFLNQEKVRNFSAEKTEEKIVWKRVYIIYIKRGARLEKRKKRGIKGNMGIKFILPDRICEKKTAKLLL